MRGQFLKKNNVVSVRDWIFFHNCIIFFSITSWSVFTYQQTNIFSAVQHLAIPRLCKALIYMIISTKKCIISSGRTCTEHIAAYSYWIRLKIVRKSKTAYIVRKQCVIVTTVSKSKTLVNVSTDESSHTSLAFNIKFVNWIYFSFLKYASADFRFLLKVRSFGQ